MVELVGVERTLMHLRTCRADAIDLVANLAALVDSPALVGEAEAELRATWADECRPALAHLIAALDGARGELERRDG